MTAYPRGLWGYWLCEGGTSAVCMHALSYFFFLLFLMAIGCHASTSSGVGAHPSAWPPFPRHGSQRDPSSARTCAIILVYGQRACGRTLASLQQHTHPPCLPGDSHVPLLLPSLKTLSSPQCSPCVLCLTGPTFCASEQPSRTAHMVSTKQPHGAVGAAARATTPIKGGPTPHRGSAAERVPPPPHHASRLPYGQRLGGSSLVPPPPPLPPLPPTPAASPPKAPKRHPPRPVPPPLG